MDSQQNADMTNLLRWSIEQQTAATSNDTTSGQPAAPSAPHTTLDQDALRRLVLGGPSDADLMREAMATIHSPDVSLENKEIAFDNLEQLVEQIDNANNMEPMGLWQPLVDLLQSEEGEIRKWAAWVMATAVSNNTKAQERASCSRPRHELSMLIRGTATGSRRHAYISQASD
jgi:hsp70-interacting protein